MADYQMQETGQNLDAGLAWALQYKNINVQTLNADVTQLKSSSVKSGTITDITQIL